MSALLAACLVASLATPTLAEPVSIDPVKVKEGLLGNLETAVNRLAKEYENPVALTRHFPMQRRLIDARVFFELGNYQPASILLYELVERPEFRTNHEYSNALVLLGRCLRELGNPLGARKYMLRALQFGAVQAREDALYYLIDLSLGQGDRRELRRIVSGRPTPGSVKTRYALAKAVLFLNDFSRAITLLKSIPASSPIFVLSRYYLGAAQTELKQYKAAIKTFTTIVSIRPKGDDAATARDLALLAIGRLNLELGKTERAVAAYQRISRRSVHYERALFETVMAFVKREQYERALQTIDILLLIAKDEKLSLDAHVQRGKLSSDMGDFDEAVKSYNKILNRFAPIRNELNRFAKRRGNIDRFFSWLLERTSDSGTMNAPLTERTVAYLETTPAMKRVVRVFSSMGADREELREANKIALDLGRVLLSSNRVELFPHLKEGWTKALALQNQLLGLSSGILDYEYGVASAGIHGKQRDEMDQLIRWRRTLEERFSRLPTSFEEYENRQAHVDARYVNLQRKGFLVEQTVKLLKRQLIAIEKHVNAQQFAESGKKLTGKREQTIRVEIQKEKSRLGALFKDLLALRDEIKAESDRIGTGDAVGAGERNLKAKLLNAHKREGLKYDERGAFLPASGTRDFSAFGTQRDRIFKSFAKLRKVIKLIDDRVKQKALGLRRLIDAEKRHLVEYNAEMEGYERKGRKLARRMGRRLFKRAHRQMKKIVLNADVGLMEVAWQRKRDETQSIDKVRLEKAGKFQILEEENQRLMREAGGDDESGEGQP